MKYRIEKIRSRDELTSGYNSEWVKDEIIEIDIADSFFLKLKGLMFKKRVERPLMFLNCKQIHTFFMKIPIDVYYFDRSMTIIDIDENLSPNKVGKYKKETYGLIETESSVKVFELGDKIKKCKI